MEPDSSQSDDEITTEQKNRAIGLMVEQFSEGIRSLDAEMISAIFHPHSSSFSVTPRGICIEPAEAWPRIIEQAKADSTHLFRERFSVRILGADIVGTVATAKVEWTFESARIVDFYNMLKIEGKWLIVNQVYRTFILREQI